MTNKKLISCVCALMVVMGGYGICDDTMQEKIPNKMNAIHIKPVIEAMERLSEESLLILRQLAELKESDCSLCLVKGFNKDMEEDDLIAILEELSELNLILWDEEGLVVSMNPPVKKVVNEAKVKPCPRCPQR